jgi:hypothetical protein
MIVAAKHVSLPRRRSFSLLHLWAAESGKELLQQLGRNPRCQLPDDEHDNDQVADGADREDDPEPHHTMTVQKKTFTGRMMRKKEIWRF